VDDWLCRKLTSGAVPAAGTLRSSIQKAGKAAVNFLFDSDPNAVKATKAPPKTTKPFKGFTKRTSLLDVVPPDGPRPWTA
jgi:hypothetical protein